MKPISILDCTLRDGGYCNQWNFGQTNITKIIAGLTESNIDIVECGFISNKVDKNPNLSKFSSITDISLYLPNSKTRPLFVAMINYGEYNIDDIPPHQKGFIDGLRVAFHKSKMKEAIEYCKSVKNKGYKVFVQAMVSMAYSDFEFLELIDMVNNLQPYAFYIVDSFGLMKKKDLLHYYSLTENNLDKDIIIGFHSHNNLQLAFSNALSLIEMRFGRQLILDSTIYGMGRGAGNLNTEIIIDHMNSDYGYDYNLKPILTLMDEVINDFYQQNSWGYSLPNYLSAIHDAHPNYAGFLADKHTLTIEMMNDIFLCMDADKKTEFDKQYISELYLKYMDHGKIRDRHSDDFCSLISTKTVLLIGPGKSSESYRDLIVDTAKREDVITVSVNFDYPFCDVDYIFVSNINRFKSIPQFKWSKCIITSNISSNDVYMIVRYSDLLNDNDFVKDNAGLMATKFFGNYHISGILLAGFDGYSYDILDNYIDGQRIFITKKATIDATNLGMSQVFESLSKKVHIEFLTKPIYYREC